MFASACMDEDSYAAWSPFTVQDMKSYFGFMIMMGIVHLPSLSDYWKKDEVYHYSPIADSRQISQLCDPRNAETSMCVYGRILVQ